MSTQFAFSLSTSSTTRSVEVVLTINHGSCFECYCFTMVLLILVIFLSIFIILVKIIMITITTTIIMIIMITIITIIIMIIMITRMIIRFSWSYGGGWECCSSWLPSDSSTVQSSASTMRTSVEKGWFAFCVQLLECKPNIEAISTPIYEHQTCSRKVLIPNWPNDCLILIEHVLVVDSFGYSILFFLLLYLIFARVIYCEVTLHIVTLRSSWIRYELLNMRMNR